LGFDIGRENTLRDDIARLVKSPRLRPVSYYGNTRGFYLFLWNEVADRYFIWLNLHPEDSRYANPVTVKDLVDIRTGEVVSFTSQTGAIFPLQLGESFHEARFIKRGRPQSTKLVHCSQRNGQPCDDFEVHITFEWQTPKVRRSIGWESIVASITSPRMASRTIWGTPEDNPRHPCRWRGALRANASIIGRGH